jgi:drug/metabolite transporter (DMT)-like permease
LTSVIARQTAGLWLAAIAAVGFSFKAILIKLAYPYGVDAVTLLALRMLFSLPAFLYVGWRTGARAPQRLDARDMVLIALLGIVGYYGASYLDFLGLQYISVGLERLILFLYPTLVVLLSLLFLGKRIARLEVLALVLSYAGIALAFAHDVAASSNDRNVWLGGALVFGSAVAYAVYLIGNGQLVGRIGAARFTAQAMTWASVACLVQFLLINPPSSLRLPWEVYALSIAMAIFSTVAPTFMVSAAIRRIGSAKVGLIGAVGPMATIFLGWWMLGESISLIQLAGASLVMAGVLIVGLRGVRR